MTDTVERKPQDALDYPKLDPALFVIWSGSNEIWPDARRRTFYLSAKKVHTINGSALYTMQWQDAKTFPTYAAAGAWVVENRKKRGQAYDRIMISTVGELIAARFPSPKPQPKKAKK
jgi:hypothetical protein